MKQETGSKDMSLSKQRKLARSKEIASRKRKAVLSKVAIVVVCLLIVGGVAWLVASNAIKKAKSVEANANFSEQVDDNGMIKNIKASDYIKTADYNNIEVSLSEIEYSDEDVQADIDKLLENNKTLEKSEEATAANGDTVNIDYVGTVDGVEFSGGSATGSDIVLGSGKLIDDFEAQIEGHHPGDSFNVEVTFPEEYPNDETLAGKDAVFAVTLNGIYVKPEFTDEFVQEKLSEYASTTDEYRKYLKDKNYKDNLTKYVKEYVVDNSELISYPSAYLKQLKGNYKANEQYNYQYMNSLYQAYTGSAVYSSFEDYLSQTYSMTEEEFDESLEEKVTEDLKYELFCQAVAEAEGITTNLDETHEYYISEGGTEENFNTSVTNYGQGYIVQRYLCEKVIQNICGRVTVK